jgi:hypothetical protein
MGMGDGILIIFLFCLDFSEDSDGLLNGHAMWIWMKI